MSVTNTILQFNGNSALQHRGGTAAALASENPTPKAREIMIETDTNNFKISDSVTIPAGSVNKIVIGGVVVWSKKSANKYKILKNDEQVDSLTMFRIVTKVPNGDAQTDYGIGTQIVIPYHDSDNKDV